MCTVDKMLIKGIRSFGPDNVNAIEFYRPLTLIVGANGAGKTTVIECLKQACTGELPPNTRSGQSFVHDPKIENETDIKAQIKLRFITSTGQPVVVVRSFQLSQKAKAMQFKTLDSVLQTTNQDTGEKQAITYRCADIDRLVPSLMGVSKAVLENVIFVHQEDSNWPLGEGKVLKDRFDDIFAATKYTKALEVLRKLRNEKSQEVKEMKLKLDHLRTHRDAAAKLRRDLEENGSKAARIQEEIDTLQAGIQDQDAQLSRLSGALSSIETALRDSTTLGARAEEVARQAAAKRAQLTEEYASSEDSTEELQRLLSAFEGRTAKLSAALAAVGREISAKRMDVEANTGAMQKHLAAAGKAQAERDAHERNSAERDRFLLHCAGAMGLAAPARVPAATGGGLAPLSAAAVEAFCGEVESRVAAREGAVRAVKEDNRRSDERLSSNIDAVNAAIASTSEVIGVRRSTLRANEEAIERLLNQIASIRVTSEEIVDAEMRMQEVQARLDERQAAAGRERCDERAGEVKREIDALAAQISGLRQERERVVGASEASTRLRLMRLDVASREEALSGVVRAKRGKLLALLGAADGVPAPELPPMDQLRRTCEASVAGRRRAVEAKQAEVAAALKVQAETQGQLSSVRQQLAGAERQVSALREQLRSGMRSALRLGGADVDEAALPAKVSECSQRAHKLVQKKATTEASQQLGHFYLTAMREDRRCSVCMRDFASEDELNNSLALYEAELQGLPAALSAAQTKVAAAQAECEALQALLPLHARYTALQGQESRELRDRVNSLTAALAAQSNEVEEKQEELQALEEELGDVQRLVADTVVPADTKHRELTALKVEVARLEAAAASSQGGGAERSASDVDADLEQAETRRAAKESEREALMRRSTRLREEVFALSAEATSARAAAKEARERMARKEELQGQVHKLEDANAEITRQVADARAAAAPREAERDRLLAARASERQAAAAREGEAEGALREARQLADQLAEKCRLVSEYERSGRAGDLTRLQAAVADTQRRIEADQQALSELEERLKRDQKAFMERDTTRRQLEDCLAWRALQAQAEALRAELADREAAAAAIGDRRELQAAHSRASGERQALTRQQDVARGTLEAVKQASAGCASALKVPQYADIEGRYRRLAVEVKTTELALGDLDKYHKALEKALLTFHTSKMSDINAIIKELWQKTYRGQDIDYIAIKADADATRSYNYRVVMYSGGAELEMRGRCSAGQKVLACLIIRLALAETFCLNCGILALDEPTTNLDAENAGSLAEALRAIMISRKEQHNFQLIVITHDENFAHLIGTRDHAEYLWRITKDDRQHTHLAQEEIDEQ